MKSVITHFIKYPVAANVLILSFFILGTMGLSSLKSSFFPLNESRIITIQTTYPGASPQEMEEGIVLKIEDNIRGLIGVERFTSVSSENSASVRVEVLKGFDVDVVLADIKNAVDKVPSFPVGMEPPVISKDIFRTEAISFVVNGEGISLLALKAIGREIETDLRSKDGISQVEISGFPSEEIEIAISEDKLRAYNLTFQEVAQAVSSTNILMTGGSIKTAHEEYLIRVNNRAYHGEDLDYIIIKAEPTGKKIRLRDVATVRDKWSENPDRSYYNGSPSVRIQVNTTNSEDLIGVAETTRNYARAGFASHSLAGTFEGLGIDTRAHVDSNYLVICPPLAVQAGLGELGRNGILVHHKYGPGVRLGLVTVDAEMAVDKPQSFGISEFCRTCAKCARECPSASIPKGDAEIVRGAKKWPILPERCYHYWRTQGSDCGICIRACPFAKPDSKLHRMVRSSIKSTPIFNRLFLWGHDLVYGKSAGPKKPPHLNIKSSN